MSQLQVTGEAKIRDIQGPVVANDGVVTALDGAASQYVRGDGTLADFPTSSGGGSSVSYYLNSSVSQGTIGGVAYRELSKDPIIGTGTDIAIVSNGYIASYITDANDPDVVLVPGGNFNCEFYFSVNNNTGNPFTYAELYKYDGTTFTLLGSSVGVPEYINQGTIIAPYYFAIPVATAALALTDRLAIRIYVNVDGRIVTLHTENGHLCQVVTTLSKGMVSLNNLTDQSQFLTTGTAGTNFAIASTGDTHTFNLPVASATNTGKLSSTDWSTFNGKVPYTGANANVDLGANSLTSTGVTIAKSAGISTLTFPQGTNDPAFIQHEESTANTGIMRFSVGDDNDATDYFVFGNISGTSGAYVERFKITSSGIVNLGTWQGTAIADAYIASAATWNAKQNAITLTTTGTSGAATFVSNTLNIPQYQGLLTNPVTGTGTTNNLPKFTGASTIGDSAITDDGTTVTLVSRALSGVSALFSSSITSNLSLTVNRFSNGDYLALKIENRPITAGNNGVGIIAFFSNKADATTDTYTSGKIYGKFDSDSYNAARITLSTVTGNNIYQDVLTAKDTNVGIGTINPAQTLDLYTTSTTANGVGTAIQIQSAGTGANQGWVGVNKGTGNGLTFSVQNNSIIFNTDASTKFGGTEKFRISTDRSTFTHPLSILTNDNNFEFNVLLRNNNTGTQALTGFGLSDSSNVRKGQVLWIPSNYVTTSLQNSFLVSSVTNVPLILCADATGADTPNIIFQSGATDRMVLVGSTGNFGIGLSAPSERLEVSAANARIKITSSTNTNNAGLSFSAKDASNSVQSGGVYYIPNGTPYLTLSGAGTNPHLSINTSGNVGIGTTSPIALLNIYGSTHLQLQNATTGSASSDGTRIQLDGNNLQIINRETADTILYTADTERFRISSAGDATFTNSVSATGYIANNGTYQMQMGMMSNDGYILALKNSDASATNLRFYTGITEKMRITSGGFVAVGASITNGRLGVRGTTNDSSAYAFEAANSSGSTLFITRNDGVSSFFGNVGIGTSSPTDSYSFGKALDVSGVNGAALYFRYSTDPTNQFGIIGYDRTGQGLVLGTNNALPILFNTSATERMRIASGGTVGIGTSSPNAGYKLNVNGNTYLIGATSASGSFALIIQNSSLTSLFSVQNDGVVGVNNLAGTGSRAVLADAGGNLSAPVSDISVKQNISTIGYGLNEILKMNPVWFDFIDEYKNYGEGRQNGNIAQEMAEIIPEAVFTTPSTGKMGINYDQMHAVYIKAIQELKLEIEQLKNK